MKFKSSNQRKAVMAKLRNKKFTVVATVDTIGYKTLKYTVIAKNRKQAIKKVKSSDYESSEVIDESENQSGNIKIHKRLK